MIPQLASCSSTIATHDISNPQPIFTIAPHSEAINCVTWNHNNIVLASAGTDGKINLIHSTKGNVISTYDDQKQVPGFSQIPSINSIEFSSGSFMLASGQSNGIVKIYDLKQKRTPITYSNHLGSVTSVAWHPSEQFIASSSITGKIHLNSINNNNSTNNSGGFSNGGANTSIEPIILREAVAVSKIRFSPFRQNFLATSCDDGRTTLWDVNSRTQVCNFANHTNKVSDISFSTHNQVLLCSASLDKLINFFDINEKKAVKTITASQPLTSLVFSHDSYTIIVGTLFGDIFVYDLRTGSNPKTTLNGHAPNQPINCLAISTVQDLSKKSSQQRTTPPPQPQPSNPQISSMQQQQQPQQQHLNAQQQQQQSSLPPQPLRNVNDSINQMKLSNTSKMSQQPKTERNNSSGFLEKDTTGQSTFRTNYQTENQSGQTIDRSNFLSAPKTPGAQQQQFQQPMQPQSQQLQQQPLKPSTPLASAHSSQIKGPSNSFMSGNASPIPAGKMSSTFQSEASNVFQNMKSASKGESMMNPRSSGTNFEQPDSTPSSLNHNYSTKHLYNEDQFSNNDLKRSYVVSELPPKQSTIIERQVNGRQNRTTSNNNNNNLTADDEFSDRQQSFFNNKLANQSLELKQYVAEEISNLHIELIRQFQIQQNEMSNILAFYLNKNSKLEDRILALEAENAMLKKSSY